MVLESPFPHKIVNVGSIVSIGNNEQYVNDVVGDLTFANHLTNIYFEMTSELLSAECQALLFEMSLYQDTVGAY